MMKKIVLLSLLMTMMDVSNAQVDTFTLNNMPRYFYLGNQWFDYDEYFAPLYPRHSDGTICHAPALVYDVIFCSSYNNYGPGLLGVEIFVNTYQQEHLPEGYHYIKNFAAGKHTDTTLRIAGIALLFPRYYDDSMVRNTLITQGFDAISLKLMDTTMNVLAEGPSLLNEEKNTFLFNGTHREVVSAFSFSDDPTIGAGDGSSFIYYDIHEVYFNTSLTVTDSFYLGACLRKNLADGKEEVGVAIPSIYELHTNLPCTEHITSPFNWKAQGGDHLADFIPPVTNIFESVDDSTWFTTTPGEDNYGYMLIFPILEPDCGLRGAIDWNSLGGGNVRLRWESGSNDTLWEVSYGPAGIEPEDGTVVSTTSPSIVLSGIAPDSHYVAYVRAQCMRYRDTVWSDWSDSISIFLSTQGIDSMDKDGGIVLLPNPASNSVLLTTEAPLTGIDVYTAAGAFYKHLPASGNAADIDVSSWPSGTYLLHISTPLGITTKKLIVQ